MGLQHMEFTLSSFSNSQVGKTIISCDFIVQFRVLRLGQHYNWMEC